MQNRVKIKVKENTHQKHDEKVENLVCIGVDEITDRDTLIYKETMEENKEKSQKKIQETRTLTDFHKGDGI